MHDVITIGHDQTAKFKFANILVSRFSGEIAKFFTRQYFGVYGIFDLCIQVTTLSDKMLIELAFSGT